MKENKTELTLEREVLTEESTIGKLYIDGELECYTLEDTDRYLESGGVKVPGATAIPRGKYKLIINKSQRFQRDMPLLLDVPQFTGIRIHAGNTASDTEGCILTGTKASHNHLMESRVAFEKLFTKLVAALENGEVTIEIL